MSRLLLITAALTGLTHPSPAAAPTPVLALKGFDPVALTAGQELAGKDDLDVVRGLFRYRFANDMNKLAFEAKPEVYGIQFNGACGKMGPFSGTGNADRYHVHDGRIYVFASESCRSAFKAAPEKHIERPNPVPDGTAEQRKRGAELVARALDGFGGAKAVDSVERFEAVIKHVYKQGDKEVIGARRVAWAFPGQFHDEEKFSTAYGFVIRGAGSFQFAGRESYPLDPAVRDVGRRQALREPLAMLRNRTANGFVAVAHGPAKLDGVPVEQVAVALDGATSIWSIDPASSRVLQTSFQARHGTVGENIVKYTDFRTADGLTLPYRRTAFFNGKERTSPEVRVEKYLVNGQVEPGLFDEPK